MTADNFSYSAKKYESYMILDQKNITKKKRTKEKNVKGNFAFNKTYYWQFRCIGPGGTVCQLSIQWCWPGRWCIQILNLAIMYQKT